jgi:hypothetical protein
MRRTMAIAVGVCLIVAVVAVTAVAWVRLQGYALQRGVVGSATGGELQGTGYRLNSTVGQPVVGESGAEGSYSVVSGYPSGTESAYEVYLPLVMRNN